MAFCRALQTDKLKSPAIPRPVGAETKNDWCIIWLISQTPLTLSRNIPRCNFDPLKSHFYIVKLEFTGYTLFFLILLKNIDCVYSLEPPRRGGSNEYPQSMFWAEIWKIAEFFVWKFSDFGGKFFYIFE